MKVDSKLAIGGKIDAIGIFLSVACAIHCLALPLLLGVLPLLGLELLADHEFEHFMMFAIFGVAGLTALHGVRIHGKYSVLGFFAVGLVAFLFVRPALGEELHPITTLIGGSAFIVGHWLNWKYRRVEKPECACVSQMAKQPQLSQ